MANKAKKKKLPRSLELLKRRAAGMAAATRGRAKVIEDKRHQTPPARKQIDAELKDMDEQ
ncbi:MAG TPA: hypothetical protein VEK08_26215 [Planctomycetota bacterium]|nr:hypothetical protein [Planctomycetota bacterium]